MKIFLVRHGQTDWNKKNVIQGLKGGRLNATGRRQAKTIALFLKGENISSIYSSDSFRARQTASEISKATGAKPTFSPKLRELDGGIFAGKTREEVSKKYSSLMREREHDPYHFKRPKGESYADVEQRVRPLLEKILSAHSKENIAIVSHQGTNRVVLRVLLGLEKNEAVQLSHPQDCVYEIAVNEGGTSVAHHRGGKRGEGLLKR